MIPLPFRTQFVISLPVVFLAAGLSWAAAAPGMALPSTLTAVALVTIAATAVTLNAARNARPNGSVGQLLYETERGAGNRPSMARRRTP